MTVLQRQGISFPLLPLTICEVFKGELCTLLSQDTVP